MFGRTLPLKSLAIYCRSLGTLFETGVSAKKSFRIAGEKSSHERLRRESMLLIYEIESGSDISSAMRERNVFPELMISMISVAEKTGSLPEVLKGLADHYENLVKLRRGFVRAIAWPVFQFFAAVFVIAGLIYILGWIADMRGSGSIDVLGWGLTGTRGALIWLGSVFGTLFVLFLGYKFMRASLSGQQYLDNFLIRIPVVGNCMRAFGIARFAWAYHLTQEAGMPVDESIQAATDATSNGAFIGQADRIIYWIQQGELVTDAFRESGLFPNDVIEMIHVGETTGTVPEMLHRLGPQFEEQAKRSLEALATVFGWVVWCLVAGFIIFIVFSIMFWYLGMIQSLTA